MGSLPTGTNFHIRYVNQEFYSADNKTFRFGDPEIRCLTNAVVGQDGKNNPPRSGFPLTGDVRLSDMRGKPLPADGTLSYTVPGTYTLPMPVHTWLTVQVNGAGGGGGGWGEEDHGIVMGTDVNIHTNPGGNGTAGYPSNFTNPYYGTLSAEAGTGGPGANPRSGPTTTAVNGSGGTSGDETLLTISAGGAGNGGLCSAAPTLYWNNENYYAPLTSTRYCFNQGNAFRLICVWSSVGAICHINVFQGGGAGGSGGRVTKQWRHDVTPSFIPWADDSGVVNSTIVVGAGGAQGARGYANPAGTFDALGQGQSGYVTVTFSSTEPPVIPPEPPPPTPTVPVETSYDGYITCGSQSTPAGYVTGYAVNTYSNVSGSPTWITIGSIYIGYNDAYTQTPTFTHNGIQYVVKAMLTPPGSSNVSVRVSLQTGSAYNYPVGITQMSISLFYVDAINEHHVYSSDFVDYSEYIAPAPNEEYSYSFSFPLGFTLPVTGRVQWIFTARGPA